MDDTRPCYLYVLNGNGMILVARGTMFGVTIILHGMKLSDDEVKVTVEEVVIPDALVPLLTNQILIVAQHFNLFSLVLNSCLVLFPTLNMDSHYKLLNFGLYILMMSKLKYFSM